jgi:hypothetical protein
VRDTLSSRERRPWLRLRLVARRAVAIAEADLAGLPASHGTGVPLFEQAFKNIDDVLRNESGCGTELDYTEQTSWLLFLKYLDDLERDLAEHAGLKGEPYTYILNES